MEEMEAESSGEEEASYSGASDLGEGEEEEEEGQYFASKVSGECTLYSRVGQRLIQD